MKDDKILSITNNVQWIGVLDYDIRTFDIVMETKFGTTYNSYFINAGKKTIVETVKEKFWDVYYAKIKQVVDPKDIEYVVLNHTEPDHSGSLKNLLKIAPNITVIGSGNAIRYLKDLMNIDFKHLIVKDGSTLDLGNKTLHFIAAPNLHWPDSIFSYLSEDKILFSCDVFSAHFCDYNMYDDKVGDFDQAFKYYFDVILKPFSKYLIKAIEKITYFEIKTICTGHGPILRSNWKKYVDLSYDYAQQALKTPDHPKVFIPFVSAYQKTELIAKAIAEGVKQAGKIEVEVMDIENVSISELNEKVEKCFGIIIGSPTINQNILLPIYKLYSVLSPIRDKNKLAGGFGSYGWSGDNKNLIQSNLENLKLKFFQEGVFFKFSPNNEQIKEAIDYGKAFGKELLKQSYTIS